LSGVPGSRIAPPCPAAPRDRLVADGYRTYWECVLPEGAGTPPLSGLWREPMLAQQHFSSWRSRRDGRDLGGPISLAWVSTGTCAPKFTRVEASEAGPILLHSASLARAAASASPQGVDADTDHFGLRDRAGVADGPSVSSSIRCTAKQGRVQKVGSERKLHPRAVLARPKLVTREPLRIRIQRRLRDARS